MGADRQSVCDTCKLTVGSAGVWSGLQSMDITVTAQPACRVGHIDQQVCMYVCMYVFVQIGLSIRSSIHLHPPAYISQSSQHPTLFASSVLQQDTHTTPPLPKTYTPHAQQNRLVWSVSLSFSRCQSVSQSLALA